MVKTCFAYGCNSGLRSDLARRKAAGLKPLSQFKAPKELLKAWQKACNRDHFEACHTLCELHFSKDDILEEFDEINIGGEVIKESRHQKKLAEGAIPRYWPNSPKYLNKPKAKKRKCRNPDPKGSGLIKRKHCGNDKTTDHNKSNEVQPDHLEPPININQDLDEDKISELTIDIQMPNSRWNKFLCERGTVYAHINEQIKVDKYILIKKQPLATEVYLCETRATEIERPVESSNDLQSLLYDVDLLRLCEGTCIKGGRNTKCTLFIPNRARSNRCRACRTERKQILNSSVKKLRAINRSLTKRRKLSKTRSDQNRRLKKRILTLQQQLKRCQKKCRELDDKKIEDLVASMPINHQEAVKICIKAARLKNKKGIRYSNQWIYECILLKIKSGSAYRKMIRDNFLPLPTPRHLSRYIERIRPAYGFNETTFKMMEEKGRHMKSDERRGALLIDEMALTEGMYYDKNKLQMEGFVDLGKHTPPESFSQLGDHALVFMYQPFKGAWFQAIGAFLSKGAAHGPTLEKLTTEAILLLEKHGFSVDEVTTDAGSWNRNMWTLFGIDEDNVSCSHPTSIDEDENDPNGRRLWFCSDFPHLVKCTWTRVINKEILETPDGIVKKEHWKVLAERDSEVLKHINICNKLTPDHVNPTNWQTMNVNMAFQFFSESVARSMEHYRDVEKVPELKDCQGSVAFIRRMDRLITAMNSRNAWDGIRNDEEHESNKAISEFLEFIKVWKAQQRDKEKQLTRENHLGYLVSLTGALELIKFLSAEVGFQYLMARRINQDALEHFFGRCRGACGGDSHPDPKHFIQVFRLLQTSSLLQPPRGSNVSGGEMLQSLLSLKDVLKEGDLQKRIDFETKLDDLLDSGEGDELIFPKEKSTGNDHDHTYHVYTKIDDYAFEMFAGYVTRRARKFASAKTCDDCFKSLGQTCTRDNVEETQYLIEKRSHGYLLTASRDLYALLYKLESCILEVLSKSKLHRHILLEVMDRLKHESFKELTVGCQEHKKELTTSVMEFFINTRMIFACKRYVKKISEAKEKKKHAKQLLKLQRLNALKPTTCGNEQQTSNNKRTATKKSAGPPAKKHKSTVTENPHTASLELSAPAIKQKSTKVMSTKPPRQEPAKQKKTTSRKPKTRPLKGKQDDAQKQLPSKKPKRAPEKENSGAMQLNTDTTAYNPRRTRKVPSRYRE